MDYDTAGYLAEMLALEHATVLELREDLARFQRRSLENTQSIAEQRARADAAEQRAADLTAEVESWRNLARQYEKERNEARAKLASASTPAGEAEPLPCVCGSEAVVTEISFDTHDGWYAYCVNDACQREIRNYETRADAVAAWNCRTAAEEA